MPYCPECKYEYEKDNKQCPDCKVELVDELKKEPVDFEEVMDQFPLELEGKTVKLMDCDSDIEASSVLSLLKANGVMGYQTSVGSGAYLSIAHGYSTMGVQIHVLESDLTVAKRIIASREEVLPMTIGETEVIRYEEEERAFQARRSKKMRLLLFIIWGGPLVFVACMYVLDQLAK